MTGRSVALLLALALAADAVTAVAQSPPTLPPAITTAFRLTYPGATILHVSKERRDGQVVYEVESQDGPVRRDLLYDFNGQTIEIEETIPADSLPATVHTAVGRDAPGAAVVVVERVTSGAAISYEVQVRVSGRSRILTYDAAGRRQ